MAKSPQILNLRTEKETGSGSVQQTEWDRAQHSHLPHWYGYKSKQKIPLLWEFFEKKFLLPEIQTNPYNILYFCINISKNIIRFSSKSMKRDQIKTKFSSIHNSLHLGMLMYFLTWTALVRSFLMISIGWRSGAFFRKQNQSKVLILSAT